MSLAPWTLVGQLSSARFSLVADPCPGLLARVMTPFARRDLVPEGVEARLSAGTMRIEVSLAAMPAEMVHLVAGNLGQIVGVSSVVVRQEVTGRVRRAA